MGRENSRLLYLKGGIMERQGKEQANDGGKVTKTTFTSEEYENLVTDLDFLLATLQVGHDHDGQAFPITALFYEAINKTIALRNLIDDMRPLENSLKEVRP